MQTKQFKSIEELSNAFVNQEFDELPNEIVINEQYTYQYFNTNDSGNSFNLMNYKELTKRDTITWVIYDLKSNQQAGTITPTDVSFEDSLTIPNTLLLFGWKAKGLSILPKRCVSVSRSKISNIIRIQESEERPIVGPTFDIQFPQLNGDTYEAKIDTGAGQSCLHAEQIKSSGESVSFVFEGKRITMNQSDTADIQTADNNSDKRPVVKLTVKCEHGEFKDIAFNLNDRSDMPHKILLGHNFLEQAKFLVDPLMEELEEIDFEWIKEIAEKYIV